MNIVNLDMDRNNSNYKFTDSFYKINRKSKINFIYSDETIYTSQVFNGNKNKLNNKDNLFNEEEVPDIIEDKIFIYTTYNDRNVYHFFKDVAHSIKGYLELNDNTIKLLMFNITSGLKELILSFLNYIGINNILFINKKINLIKANEIHCYINRKPHIFYKSLKLNKDIKTKKVILSRSCYKHQETLDQLKKMGYKNYHYKYGSMHRVLLNNEWEKILCDDHGFESILIEKYLFKERLEILSNIKVLVMEMGAGIIHLHWLPDNTKVIILANKINKSWVDVIKKVFNNLKIEIVIGKSFYDNFLDKFKYNQPWLIDNDEVIETYIKCKEII